MSWQEDFAKLPAKPAEPQTSFIQQLMQMLAGSGPTGYSPAIRQNLGMNTPQGGAFQTSGMTQTMGPQGYKPRAVRPDPVTPPIPSNPVNPTVTPNTPTTPTAPTPVDPNSKPGYTLINGGWWPNSLLARRPNMQLGANSR
jgi:hypothetical protein